MSKSKIITTDMPLAVFLMVLVNSNDITGDGTNKEQIQELVDPFYGDESKDHMSEEMYDNTAGTKIAYREEQKWYEPIVEHLKKYNFSALLKMFYHFWAIDDIQTVTDIEAVKRCYKIMVEHRTTTANTKFDNNYCWKIAQIFLHEYESVECLNTLEQSYVVRKELVRNASGTLYLAGTTLKDALSISREHEEASIIGDIFSNLHISVVNIYLLNYLYVGINREDASKEIETSILNILSKARAMLSHSHHCPKFNIVLLSDFDIAFSLLTQEKLIKRSTHLFTQTRCYRGQYLVFGNQTEEYRTLKQYLDFLCEKAYNIDLNSHKDSPYQIKKELQKNVMLRERIEYKKVHPVQLENLVRSSFVEQAEKDTTEIENYIIPDANQKILLSYLKQTELLLEKLVQEHDKSGWAKIVPSPDLGFPNNVIRIAGGFLTGALYDWSCSVPIIPIDATVNTCTSSVFSLSQFPSDLTKSQFHSIVESIRNGAMDIGYAFNFKSGNHFLTLAKDDSNSYYLVLHSSAKQSKESCFGLYPSERAWYREHIKTIYNTEQTRYLRYIRGDAAVQFYDYAIRFREFNEEIHCYVAEQFATLCGAKLSHDSYIKHHYGMPTASSIAIGTFVIDVDENNSHNRIVPIFSDYGKDICLYQIYTQQERTYTITGTNNRVVLVPHGWGQVIDNFADLGFEEIETEEKRKLVLQLSDNSIVKLPVTASERLTLPQKHVRNFTDINAFLKQHNTYLKGEVKQMLHPVFCHCSRNDLTP